MLGLDRFLEELISTLAYRGNLLFQIALDGKENYRYRGKRLVLTNYARQFKSRALWHVHVQKHDVRLGLHEEGNDQ